MRKRISKIAVCLFVLSLALSAQEFRASINGEVTDPSGAPIAGANVVVTNLERRTPVEAVTNSAGLFFVQFLIPGNYSVKVEKTGFKTYVQENISLVASDKVSLPIKLDIGALAESVTVHGEPPLLQTETASRVSTIENRVLENVPTNGRNLFSLEYTLPGVVKTSTYWGSMELYAFGNINGVTISGGRQGENETLIDGVTNTRTDRGVVLAPSLNATQEFSVRTNIYDAQFGRVGGGVTSIVVKSGTNALHGEMFEFLKNNKLNANDWAANAAGEPSSRFQNNTFGFEVAGPVYIPKLFDGRNRLFFMVSLEALRERAQSLIAVTLPTAQQLTGDFSGLVNAAGQPVTIYDPLKLTKNAAGAFVREPFLGNKIPANRINPVAAKVASFYPLANHAPTGLDNANNFVNSNSSRNSYDAWLGKTDFRASDRSNIAFRYGQTPWENRAKIVWGTNAAEPSGEAPSTRVSKNWGADWTYTLSPTLLFNLRGGLARYEGFSGNDFARGFDPRQLGFPSSLVGQFTTLQFPAFRFDASQYSAIGATQVTGYEARDTYSIQPNMSWIRGRHSLKFGAEGRLYNYNQIQPAAASGSYTFGTNWTQADPLRADNQSGNSFASFLLGLPNGGSVSRNIDPSYQNKYYAVFVQDDWKVTPRLTLNLGLRWDYETPLTERHNRMVRGFGFSQPSSIANRVPGLNLTGGLIYAGTSGESRYAFNPDKNNFQPRIGVAWEFRQNWVMRAGYGISYLGQSAFGPATGFSQPTNLIASTDAGLTPAVDLSNPFPSSLFPNGLLQPIGSSLGLGTNLGLGVTAQYLNRRLASSQQYSFGLQHQFRGEWLVDVSYVGNRTSNLPVSLPMNFIPRDKLLALPVADRPAFFTGQVPNPFAGLLPNSAINGATVPRQQLLYAFPEFSQVTITDVSIGRQRYDALEAKATHRFRGGYSAQVAYTYAKTIEAVSVLNQQDIDLTDLTNTRLERRLGQWDVPHHFAAVISGELPFGRRKRYGSNWHPIVNGFLGNWNVNMQYVHQLGFPFDFPNAAPLSAGSARLDPDGRDALAKTKGRSQFDPSYDKWFNTALFPTKAQAPFTLRDFPTRFPDVRSPLLTVSEISLYKEFPIKERLKLQFRVDLQNAFNYPFFGKLQSANVADSRFGQLQADITNEPRLVVGVIKVIF